MLTGARCKRQRDVDHDENQTAIGSYGGAMWMAVKCIAKLEITGDDTQATTKRASGGAALRATESRNV
jgi:hypothetical protein